MFAYETCYAHVDIDGADPAAFEPPPMLLVETSPGHTQGVWEFATMVEPKVAESVSRHLTRTYGGDANGWSITKFLRCPGSLNHKPMYICRRSRSSGTRGPNCVLAAWPTVSAVHRQDTKAQAPGAVTREPAEYDAALARLRQCRPR